MIKRYMMLEEDQGCEPIERPDGEWVKYKDVKNIITIYEACKKTTEAFRKDNIKIEAVIDPEELAKIQPRIDEIKAACLYPKFELNEVEMKNFERFKEKHGIGKCDAFPDCTGANFVFSFMPTGLGTCISVKCGCGKEQDITDLSDL